MMKASYNWLKRYVDIDVPAEDLAHGLTMSGSEIESMEDAGGDKVFSLEITSNRPDCLNMIGLAREVSAVFDKDLRLPDMSIPEEALGDEGPEVKCVIKSGKLCPRYTARVIRDVKVKGASAEVKGLIEALGLRGVNNVVDVTNFCLLETGQPLHAFDLDKVRGGRIVVREAKKGEKITTIDGVERELSGGMLVIADTERPIAVAGVMGGKDTEVTEGTKNILLESAYFDPLSVRRTARELGLSSDSSYRFERGVDKEMITPASDRAAALISAETGGKICRFYDAGKLEPEDVTIEFDVDKAGRILGVPLDPGKVKSIFARLGLALLKEDGSRLALKAPSFREDLKREIDLVEEAARIHGYQNIPARVNKLIPQVKRKERERLVGEKIRGLLPSMGLSEIMTYSLISASEAERFSGISEAPVGLANPLSEEHQYLTPQLVGGMLKAVSWNLNRKNSDLGLFEIGKIYYHTPKGKRRFSETGALCVGLTGALRRNWEEGERLADLYDLKGIVEVLFKRLKLVPAFTPADKAGFNYSSSVALRGSKEEIGFFGEVSRKVLQEYGIEKPVYVCQVRLDGVLDKAVLKNVYHSIPRFPSSSRDVSILCDRSLPAGDIQKIIGETGEDLITGIELIDRYEGDKVPPGKRSLTYTIEYGLATRTLKDEEVESMHTRVKEALAERLKVSFR